MRIHFKNVDQGDSIVLKWMDGGKAKYAIIDCNLNSANQNPVLNFIKSERVEHIEFCILSHPHEDHFSGFNELLDYCEKQKVSIGAFYHTARSIPEYLQSAVRSHQAKSELGKLFHKIVSFMGRNIIWDGGSIDHLTKEIDLTNEIKVKFLAPTEKEYSVYNSRKFKTLSPTFSKNASNTNILSTIIKIYSGEKWMVLLTSDAERQTFKRVMEKHIHLHSTKTSLVQVPHHGSFDNFNRTFWKQILHDVSSPAVISVGDNSYGHPDEKVISDIKELEFGVFSTNKIGPLNDALSFPAALADSALDMISTVRKRPRFDPALEGDKIFELNGDKFELI